MQQFNTVLARPKQSERFDSPLILFAFRSRFSLGHAHTTNSKEVTNSNHDASSSFISKFHHKFRLTALKVNEIKLNHTSKELELNF